MVKIGVFDSGVGGQAFVNAIGQAFPDAEILYETDRENLPYGGKSPERLVELAVPKLKKLETDGCSVIVVACNTVSTTIIAEVRKAIKVPVVAVEPMIKPACEQTKTKKIVVCATPATLKSSRYKQLIEQYAKGVEIYEPNCSDWTMMIENKTQNIRNIESDIIKPLKAGADTIVLACTHYHWIEQEIKQIANKFGATVIQPEEAVVRRLRTVLSQP